MGLTEVTEDDARIAKEREIANTAVTMKQYELNRLKKKLIDARRQRDEWRRDYVELDRRVQASISNVIRHYHADQTNRMQKQIDDLRGIISKCELIITKKNDQLLELHERLDAARKEKL